MDEKNSIVQWVVIGVSLLIAVAAVLMFALTKAKVAPDPTPISVWGALDPAAFSQATQSLRDNETLAYEMAYRQVPADQFEDTLIRALADGYGPDLLIYPQETIFQYSERFATVPYTLMTERVYRDTYLDVASEFLTPSGIRALPIVADPIVMYWNRDILRRYGFVAPPQYWDELPQYVEAMVAREGSTVQQPAIALGTTRNIESFKDIFSTLLLQTGNSIVTQNNGVSQVDFGLHRSGGMLSALSVVRFYNEFADPAKAVYTWNSALPPSRDVFVSGEMGIYIGPASDLVYIRRRNPNLNFDVARIPSVRGNEPVTFARVYAAAPSARSARMSLALAAARDLSSSTLAQSFSSAFALAPVHRALVNVQSEDPQVSVLLRAMVNARLWYDRQPEATRELFATFVNDVASGRVHAEQATHNAHEALTKLY